MEQKETGEQSAIQDEGNQESSVATTVTKGHSVSHEMICSLFRNYIGINKFNHWGTNFLALTVLRDDEAEEKRTKGFVQSLLEDRTLLKENNLNEDRRN